MKLATEHFHTTIPLAKSLRSLPGVLTFGVSILYSQGSTGSLGGIVLEKQAKQPLEFVNVQLEGTNLGASTDSKGQYKVQGVPTGIYTVRFSLIGFKEKTVPGTHVMPGENSLDVVLQDTTVNMDEIIITPRNERYDASGVTARLSPQMVVNAPGSAQDVFWVIQTLPGIASDGDNSKLYVRGGSPDENLVLYDGATIRNPFHFDMMGGGYWSVFNSRLVNKVEFYAGGFPARYGDRLSSVLFIENRTGSMERVRGEASISMSDAGGTIEAPLSFARGSGMISVRRSYFDAFIRFTDLAGDYAVLPYFFDINSKFDFDLSSKHSLTISGLSTWERMIGYFDRPNYRGNFSWENNSSVGAARLRSLFSDFFLSEFIFSLSQGDNSTIQPRNAIETYRIREWTIKEDFTLIFPSHELHIGAWLVHEADDVTIDIPLEVALNFSALKQHGSGISWKPSFYVDDRWSSNTGATASLGVRYDYVAVSREHTLSPRFNLSYAWNEHMSLSADYGWYYQSPRPYELDIRNSMRSKRAESFGIGVKHEVGDEIVVSFEVYKKNLSRLVSIDSSWNLSNEGYGFARGGEFYIQMKNSSGFFGWLSYTYSLSKRKEGLGRNLHYFDFDRPHLVSLVANHVFLKNWQAGARFRYGSGRPYTPVTSAWYSPQEERWFPVPGEHNSDRYPAYSRLDIRATRHFVFESWNLDIYLELLNTLGRKNIIHYMWDERYSSKEPLTIFPFLPILGITAQF